MEERKESHQVGEESGIPTCGKQMKGSVAMEIWLAEIGVTCPPCLMMMGRCRGYRGELQSENEQGESHDRECFNIYFLNREEKKKENLNLGLTT